MFLTSALEIMLQLYKEYCSVLKEKWRDHDLCLGLFLSSVGFVFVFVFLSFHPYTQCPPSAPPPANKHGHVRMPAVGKVCGCWKI